MAEVVEVRRSKRRTRTVSAYRQDGKVIVLIPARFTRAEEEQWVADMLARLERKKDRSTDADLMVRAGRLNRDWLGGHAVPEGVRWVTNMERRWGSCTTTTGQIRLSHKLQKMPAYVVDYVLLHELAHLIEPNHSPRFHALVDAFPQAERAKGYLEGVSAAAGLDLEDF